MALSLPRIYLFRVVAILLLLMGAVEVYACDRADACITSATGQNSDCDHPSGDNCVCCCHHAVPSAVVTLNAVEYVREGLPPAPLVRTTSMALPIDRPPQL